MNVISKIKLPHYFKHVETVWRVSGAKKMPKIKLQLNLWILINIHVYFFFIVIFPWSRNVGVGDNFYIFWSYFFYLLQDITKDSICYTRHIKVGPNQQSTRICHSQNTQKHVLLRRYSSIWFIHDSRFKDSKKIC